MDFDTFFLKSQELWETEGNATQLDEEQGKIYYKLYKPEVNTPSLSKKNTKEDGFPPTPKGMGIQPTIL